MNGSDHSVKRRVWAEASRAKKKHQLLARRPLKRSSRIVIRIGFRWFKLYERAANICHSVSQSTPTRMNRGRQAFEPTIRRAFHLYWRWARGVTLGIRGFVIDKDQRIFLVTHTYAPGWQLPGGGVEPGETMAEALARELVEEGNIEILDPPVLHGLFFNSRVSQRDHVALFIIRSFRQAARARTQSGDCRTRLFFS